MSSDAAFTGLRARIPPALKLPYRYLVGSLPLAWRQGPAYREVRALLARSRGWGREELHDYQCRRLQALIRHAYKEVPYYREVMRQRGLTPESIRTPQDLGKLPLLDKTIVRERLSDLLAQNFPARERAYQSTGGTSGRPLSFFVQRNVSAARERAFMDTLWERAGVRPGDPLVVLRNNVLPGSRCWEYNPKARQLVLDPFKLSPDNVAGYAGAINRSGIRVLHTYPSAAAALLRLAREAGLRIRFDLILASSENVYPGQREALEEGFGGRFFTWYGHSELLVLAGECEHSPLAHAFPEYGILELVDEKGDVIDRPGITGEITGTGFNNEVMPLLRYRTGDYAEYAPGAGSPAVPAHAGPACACGRAYPLLTSIRGRWLQEMIIGAHGERISITALNMHSDVFERVRQFQFFQDAPGEVEIRIVRGEGYKEEDTRRIAEELAHKLGNAVRLGVVFLEEIPPTGRGKHRFLIQELPADTPPARRDA